MTVTPDQLVDAYRRWHVALVERPGWRTRNTGRAWDPIGIVVHHDALNDQVSTERGLQIIEDGRPDLSGPLAANWHEDDGIVYLCSFGNANHGGRFAAEPVARTRLGLPPRGDAYPLGLVDDGPIANGLYYGDEVHNAGDGRDPYEPGQMQTLTLSLAARCELHGWTGARVIGHREGTRRKIDPRGIDMAALRDAVDVCLYVGPLAALPTPNQEDDMLPEQIAQLDALHSRIGTIDSTASAVEQLWARRGLIDSLANLNLGDDVDEAEVARLVLSGLGSLSEGQVQSIVDAMPAAVKQALREGTG